MTHFALDMYQTMGIGVVALLLGRYLTGRVGFLRRFCIPVPVSGGIIFALAFLVLRTCCSIELSFDGTLKDICMMVFFATVGFEADFRSIRRGGKLLLVMLVLLVLLVVLQNVVSVGIACGLSLPPVFGMVAGSIPMVGGHGTAGGFSPLLESLGIDGASSFTMASATFGLVAGSLLGGPLGERLIRIHKLCQPDGSSSKPLSVPTGEETYFECRDKFDVASSEMLDSMAKAVFQIFLAIALGIIVSKCLSLTSITFPTYFGTLLVAALMRNCSEGIGWCPRIEMRTVSMVGNLSLVLFISMAMVSLRLWELASLAIPLTSMLFAEVLLMAMFAVFVAFPLLGRDYDAALLVSGMCGFGLGATPNAMANLSTVCGKYRYSPLPFLIIPVVGSMFVDIINTTIVTLFLHFL